MHMSHELGLQTSHSRPERGAKHVGVNDFWACKVARFHCLFTGLLNVLRPSRSGPCSVRFCAPKAIYIPLMSTSIRSQSHRIAHSSGRQLSQNRRLIQVLWKHSSRRSGSLRSSFQQRFTHLHSHHVRNAIYMATRLAPHANGRILLITRKIAQY